MCVCIKQGGVGGCPFGNRPWVFNTEELEERTLSAWRTQHSQRRGHWSTCTHIHICCVHTHKDTHINALMHPCIHTVTVPLSLLHTHTRSLCLFSSSPSLFRSHKPTHSEHFNSIASLVSPLVPYPVKTPPWGQKSSGQGDNRKTAQTGNCCHIVRKQRIDIRTESE